jgi:hypothetical protein
MNLEVISAHIDPIGEDSNRNPVGTVTVTLSNDESQEFEDVDERDFGIWVESGFDPEQPPFDMAVAFTQWWKSLSAKSTSHDEDELDEEQDLEDEDELDEEQDLDDDEEEE